jgi:two-component system, LuxR family, sensor histidine kinase DctS
MKAPEPTALQAPRRPGMSVPPKPGLQVLGWRVGRLPSLWAWPLVLSLLFVAGVMGWMIKSDRDDAQARREEMISDALSLEVQISAWLDVENNRLKAVAESIARDHVRPDDFPRQALVLDGVRAFWINVTWVDAQGRIVAQVPDDAVPPNSPLRGAVAEAGISGHLMAPVAGGGQLVARYSAANLLRQRVPWWLASKYDIRLLDGSEDVVASTVNTERQPDQVWYRKALGAPLTQAWLELTSRERVVPWWRSVPMAMMSGFVVLIAVASWMLRRQMQGVERAEEAWRTEAAWRSAMENSLSVGIRARDLDGRLVYVNKTMADMVGYQTDELIGAMPPMPYWPQHELDLAMARHLRNMAGHAPREGYESRWQHRDGTLVDVMVFEAPLVDAQGQHIGWMASILNITERKRMEERERKQAETMSHHARLTMLGEVASTLAHELNQPLSAIASYNAGVLNSLRRQGGTDEAVMGALERMGEQAGHAGRIVKRIREFLTRREPQREPASLNAVVQSAVGLLRREINRQHVEVRLHLDKQLSPVLIDPILIEQVVANLVRNACDAMGAMPEPHVLDVSTSLAPGQRFAMVKVQDRGGGLSGRTIEALCAPFYSTKSDGMGMGLAICRSIIELHYGALDAQDEHPAGEPVLGAAFSFTVPLAETSTQVSKA